MVNVPKTKKKTYKKRVSTKRIKKTYKSTKVLKKVVKQVLFKVAESKHTPIDEQEYQFTTTSSALQPSVALSECLSLSQGTADGQRVGNKIHVTKANLNLIVRRNNTGSSLIPCEFHLFIGYLKQDRGALPDPFFPLIYQDGFSTLPFNGTMIRTLRKINKDLFIIHKKLVFKVGPSTSSVSQFNNNDFPVIQRKVISLKPLLGLVQYGDDGTSFNFNKDLYMWGGYVYINDTIDNLVANPELKPLDVLYFVDMEFKDI